MNPQDYSVTLGRRFRALKLWFVMRYYGREGMAEILRGQIAWRGSWRAQWKPMSDSS